jgi:hypothetical protein
VLDPKLLGLAALVRQHRFLIKVAARVLHEAAGFAQRPLLIHPLTLNSFNLKII